MQKVLALVMLFSFSIASANQCVEIFASSEVSATFTKQIQALIPHFEVQRKTLEETYFEVLELHNNLSAEKGVLPPAIEKQIITQFADRYDLPTKREDLKVFYLNALHSIYSRLAWDWKKLQVEEVMGERLSGFSLHLAQAMMDSFFTFGNMAYLGIKPEYVRETLQKQEWKSYPWKEAFQIARAWEKSEDFQRGFTYFYKWLDKQTGLPELSHNDMQRLFLAITKGTKTSSPVYCCKSSFACQVCPHNRKWLKERD